MRLKALLLCEDVRIEVGGTMTLVGVYNERLIAPPGEGALEVPRLAFVAVIGGLRGVEQLGYRQWIRLAEDEPAPAELAYEPHDPEADEHNFVLTESPMVFPDEGVYEIALDVQAGDRVQSYRYPFIVERRA